HESCICESRRLVSVSLARCSVLPRRRKSENVFARWVVVHPIAATGGPTRSWRGQGVQGMSGRSQDMERRIIQELRRDSRQSNVAIARTVGLTEGAVRRRIDLLVQAGTLRFTVEADQEFLGRPYHALLRIRCAPHQIDEVIADLADED